MQQEFLSNLISNSFYDERSARSVKSIDSTTGNWFDIHTIENSRYKLEKIDADFALGSFQETWYRLYEKVKTLLFFKRWRRIEYIEDILFERVFEENWNRLTELNK